MTISEALADCRNLENISLNIIEREYVFDINNANPTKPIHNLGTAISLVRARMSPKG
ncbi:unnamed protein product [marine sediment metagenome]|uniref:Uncharacterized protein n=1 Tax=marine sediment metagenome TaxID=412755 RepID=X1CFW5_9ZZZZ